MRHSSIVMAKPAEECSNASPVNDNECEEELCAQVPDLLEALNSAMDTVNSLQREVVEKRRLVQEAQDQAKLLEEELDVRSANATRIAKPFFEAEQSVRRASKKRRVSLCRLDDAEHELRQANACLRHVEQQVEYGACRMKAQPHRSMLLFSVISQVVLLRQKRDQLKKEDGDTLLELEKATVFSARIRQEIDPNALRRAEKYFPPLRELCDDISVLEEELRELLEELESAKSQHKNTMELLEEVSMSVHRLRSGQTVDSKSLLLHTASCFSLRSSLERPRRGCDPLATDAPQGLRGLFSPRPPPRKRRASSHQPCECHESHPVSTLSRSRRMFQRVATLYRRTRSCQVEPDTRAQKSCDF